ncbi:phosphoribosylanthranilate isomerase [Marinagarivorans algicola]|uniref:phosphoribosylanthranilate isomerase n=1 Tax=Marinagarivorans algicola TaxID=1513270 RepID=UPI0006B4F24D|nr:phosphoribosylanthranilate isomerase [Marinagarivorans algicola]
MRTRIKICGITSVEDARKASDAGADAIGLVFYPPSPRHLDDLALARDIALAAGPFVTVVGLFVNPAPTELAQVLSQVPINLVQFHGDETPAFCEQAGRPYIKALRMKPDTDIAALANQYMGARGILLDAYRKGVPGGTGETFDWSAIPHNIASPLILAGGLTPDNIIKAVAGVRPWAVDVSGGVEQAPGIKSSHKMKNFIINTLSVKP